MMVKLNAFGINRAQEELAAFHLADFNFCKKQRCYLILIVQKNGIPVEETLRLSCLYYPTK
ncbi:MAG: hypothetical protein HY673_21125 [Chloroflexi bacterium]|nr:hypothetical protein [Chloroflexota bacterium]